MAPDSMTFVEHLEELRVRLIKAILALALATLIAFFWYEDILELLTEPYRRVADTGLAVFKPTERFSLAMRISGFGGVVLASPVLLYQMWRFVWPALNRRERRWAVPISAALGLLFLVGIVLGYWSLARGLDFLLGFGGESLENVIGADRYLSFAMRFVLAFGIAFEFPVFLFAAAAMGFVDGDRLRRGRRWAVTIIVIGAAVITPSGDPITLLLLSAPLYLLYELTILAVRFGLRR